MEAATTDVRTFPPMAEHGTRARSRSLHAEQVVGGLALLGLVVGTLLLVFAAAQGATSLSTPIKGTAPGWLLFPFHGLWTNRTLDHGDIQDGFLTIVLAMLAFYGVAIWLSRRLPPAVVWSAVIVVYVICFLSPPLLLTDVFNYINYARMGVLHHLNPYTHIPHDVTRDAAYHISNWHHLPSPYGPLFTLGTYALVPLGLGGAYWGYKLAVMAAALFSLWLTVRICRRLGVQPMPALVLVGLNPMVTVYGTAGQHNDWFQMVFVLGSIELFLASRERLSAAALIGAAALKSSALALAPIGVLGQPRRKQALIGAIAGGIAFGVLSFGAFGPHLPAIGIQSKLVTPYSIPNVAGLFLGRGGEDNLVRDGFEAFFAIGTIGCAYLAWRRREPILALGWLTMISLVTIGWDMAWYVLWLLPFIAFIRNRSFRIAAICLVVWMTVQWTPNVGSWANKLGFHAQDTRTWVQNNHYTIRYLR